MNKEINVIHISKSDVNLKHKLINIFCKNKNQLLL